MKQEHHTDTGQGWLFANSSLAPKIVEKSSPETRAWFATFDGEDVFVKWYPSSLLASWGAAEIGISGGNLHPAIVPLQRVVSCTDGALLIYPRIHGQNLGDQEVRKSFGRLPTKERVRAVVTVSEALEKVADAGYMVVDWYEGNMHYDFDRREIHLFDWELCRTGGSFILEMESNYGSSRLMAPEEFVQGSRLDQLTLVFNLGRYALLSLPDLADKLAAVISRATYPSRSGRYERVQEYLEALKEAIGLL